MPRGAKFGNKNAAKYGGINIFGPKKSGVLGLLGVHELNTQGQKLMAKVNAQKGIMPKRINLKGKK